jgi:hypothetical protein
MAQLVEYLVSKHEALTLDRGMTKWAKVHPVRDYSAVRINNEGAQWALAWKEPHWLLQTEKRANHRAKLTRHFHLYKRKLKSLCVWVNKHGSMCLTHLSMLRDRCERVLIHHIDTAVTISGKGILGWLREEFFFLFIQCSLVLQTVFYRENEFAYYLYSLKRKKLNWITYFLIYLRFSKHTGRKLVASPIFLSPSICFSFPFANMSLLFKDAMLQGAHLHPSLPCSSK